MISLTGRQQQLMQAVARGLSNREIALELCLSEQTIKNQLSGIYQKIGVRSRVQLALFALQSQPAPAEAAMHTA